MQKHSEAQTHYTLGKRLVDLSATDRRNYDVFSALPVRIGTDDVAYASEEHAAYIVQACNSHEAITDALQQALDAWYARASNDERSGKYGLPTWVVNAHAALALAEVHA